MGAEIVVACGLITAIAWGISDFFSARASKFLGPIAAVVIINALGTVGYLLCFFLFLNPHVQLDAVAWWYSISAGVVASFAAVAFYRGLALGPVSIVSPVGAAYPLVTTVLAVTVFNAHLSGGQYVGIAMVIGGVLVAVELLSMQQLRKGLSRGPLWGVAAAIAWGVGFALLAQAINRAGWATATAIQQTFVVLGFAVFGPLLKGNEHISIKRMVRAVCSKYVLAAAVIQLVGVLAINYGLSREEDTGGAVIVAVSACYPVLTMLLSLRFLKEKVKPLPLIGALASIAGIVVLSLN
jgi:drug/metabolite transporter (DMT)-like permease